MWYVSTADTHLKKFSTITDSPSQFTPGDVVPKKEIYKGRGYRVYSAYSTAKARAVTIKLYEGSRAKDVSISFDNPIKLTFSLVDSSVAWQLQVLVGK